MGQYLSAPVTEKESAHGRSDALHFGLAAMQGWRVSMEDAHIAELELDADTALFAVFDGHGGGAVAKFCAERLGGELRASAAYARGDLEAALPEAFARLDALLDTPEGGAALAALGGGAAEKAAGSQTLFGDVGAPIELDAPHGAEAAPPPHSAAPSSPPAPKRLDRVPSEQFLRTALARDSLDYSEHSARPSSEAEAGAGAAGAGALAAPGSRRGSDRRAAAPPEGEHAHARNGAATGPAAPHGAGGQGCTAVAALVRGGRLVNANTGDSRAVLSVRGRAEPLSQDHKPVLLEEAARIAKAGGFVRDNRVNGALAVSRTLGDLDFKRNAALPPHEQMVVATPDVRACDLADGDEFLILACDGVWDVMSSQEAVDFVRARLRAGDAPRAAAEAVCDACLAPDLKGACRGCDNMSVVVVHFRETGRSVASALARLGARLRRALPGRRSLCRLVARASGASDAEDADDLLAREFEKASNPLGPRKSAARLELLWSASQRSAPTPCECCRGSGGIECGYCGATGLMTVGDTLFCSDEGCRACPACSGRGERPCPACNGAGKRAPWAPAPACPRPPG